MPRLLLESQLMFARHIAANFINLLIVGILVLGGYIYYAKGQYNAKGPLAEATQFEVKKGDRFVPVANRLADAGIITDARIFRVGARYTGMDNKLKFGKYSVPAGASMQEVVELISSGRAVGEQVTFPEGWTVFQIVRRLNAVEGLEGHISELPVEGSLSPNTYGYIEGEDRQKVLDRMAGAQTKILDEAWAKRQEGLPIEKKEDVLIVASIIEQETPQKDELGLVAGVIMNRLNQGIPLGMDSTTVYEFTKGDPRQMRSIRRSDLLKDTPYNTRRFKGLPPTAIGNPGKAAINAAVNPTETDFLFFVADGTGGHIFAKTVAEHNANVKKWRAIERKNKAKAAAEAAKKANEN
jgi:UPF0755 protein